MNLDYSTFFSQGQGSGVKDPEIMKIHKLEIQNKTKNKKLLDKFAFER